MGVEPERGEEEKATKVQGEREGKEKAKSRYSVSAPAFFPKETLSHARAICGGKAACIESLRYACGARVLRSCVVVGEECADRLTNRSTFSFSIAAHDKRAESEAYFSSRKNALRRKSVAKGRRKEPLTIVAFIMKYRAALND